MRIRCGAVIAACLTFCGCSSPEAARTRGGGPGADVGNRPAAIKMHEGSEQYWKTPVVIPGEAPSLDPAHQAQWLSRP